jgi:hypothetical protein
MVGTASEKLHVGSKRKIESVLKRNTHRICSGKGFRDFKVDRNEPDRCAIIYAFFDDGSEAGIFIPIAVWQTDDKYFACGNSDFR